MEILFMDIISEKWEEIKINIKNEFEITDIAFNIWIAPLKYIGCNNKLVTISVPNNQSQMVEYISKKYKSCFIAFISEMMGEIYDVDFILETENNQTGNRDGISNQGRDPIK